MLGVDFSVLIPTRDRPELLRRALASVLAQDGGEIDIIVIDDGTAPELAAELGGIEQTLAARGGRLLRLPRRARGHGQSYAINVGAAHARGGYLCFLDDDDEWIDPHHLSRAAGVIARFRGEIDVLYFDQVAFRGGQRLDRFVWTEELGRKLAAAGRPPGADGAYIVTAADLLDNQGHCHVNTTIIRKPFFDAIGGFDNAIRYENDRDFFLRSIDRARLIGYVPRTVSRHNVPDAGKKVNMSTLVSGLEKRVFQLTVLEKALLFSQQEVVRGFARRHHSYTLKNLAISLYEGRRYRLARQYALEALPAGFNLKWLGFCCWLGLLDVLRRRRGKRGDSDTMSQLPG